MGKSLGIEKSQVSVEILGRRLEAGLLGRRLEVETRMKATITMDANDDEQREKAQEAHEKLSDSDKSTAMLKNVQEALKEDAGIEVEVPQVTEEPQVEVKVETEIVSVSETPVVLPTGDDLKEVAEKAGAKDIELKITEVRTPTTPAPAKPDEDSSFVAIFLTIGITGTIVMIGGFIYWYYRYSASMAASSNRDDAGAGKSHMV